MGTMGNDSGAQSNNKSFEEIYGQLDKLEMDELIHGNYGSGNSEPVRQEKEEEDMKCGNYSDEKIRSEIEEAGQNNRWFWFPIKPEDLLKLSNNELARMIVCTNGLKKDMNDGSLSEAELNNNMSYQVDLADAVLGNNHAENRDPRGKKTLNFNYELTSNYGKALDENMTFWMPVKAEDLIKLGAKELSEMIVFNAMLRKRLREGDLTADGLAEEIAFRNVVADNILAWTLDLDRELQEAKYAAVREKEDDTAIRKEMMEKLKGDLDKLPTEKIREILSGLDR